MLIYPHISPVALQIGPVAIHWYGLMYILAFFMAWMLGQIRIKNPSFESPVNTDQLTDLIFYSALGVVLGGRIGYILFYDFSNFIANPIVLFKIWEGGMSFHGGLLGVVLAVFLYGRRIKQPFFALGDFLAPLVPLGLAAGRIGNFINGELWGRIVHAPLLWAMVYPHVDNQPRHPSEIYEFLLEGILLFLLIWIYSKKPRPRMAVTAVFILFYGLLRFICEYFRQPDEPIGFIAFGWMTEGQLLCIPMILFGLILWIIAYAKNTKNTKKT
jgi:phosphatidylglycerol:prolipoprotein diacylglycerol transferase